MVTIQDVDALQILDSRGNPTVRVRLSSQNHTVAANVPSGASTGSHEAHELRDNTEAYNGKGVSKACQHIRREIKKHVQGKTYKSQQAFDQDLIELDGTKNKERLGANALLGCSMAFSKLHAKAQGLHTHQVFGDTTTIPTPYCNIINGGDHAGNALTMQEFMIVPQQFETFHGKTRAATEVYHELKHLIEQKYGPDATSVGDEGGFAPPIQNARDALDLVEKAISNKGYTEKISLAMDPAATEFYDEDKGYNVDGEWMSPDDLVTYYEKLIADYPITSLEDPFHEEDFERFAQLRSSVKDACQIVGDDLTVSNTERVQKAAKHGSVNALILKVNQIGTVTEAIQAATLSQQKGWNVMVSHRSGETEDPFIMDLAVGINASQVKIGAPARGERTAKYNRLLEIEHLHK